VYDLMDLLNKLCGKGNGFKKEKQHRMNGTAFLLQRE